MMVSMVHDDVNAIIVAFVISWPYCFWRANGVRASVRNVVLMRTCFAHYSFWFLYVCLCVCVYSERSKMSSRLIFGANGPPLMIKFFFAAEIKNVIILAWMKLYAVLNGNKIIPFFCFIVIVCQQHLASMDSTDFRLT